MIELKLGKVKWLLSFYVRYDHFIILECKKQNNLGILENNLGAIMIKTL